MSTRIMDIIDSLYIMKHDDASICRSAVFLITWCSVQSWFPLLCLSSQCLMIVVWLFLTVTRVCLQFVIVVFPVHTHYFNQEHAIGPFERQLLQIDVYRSSVCRYLGPVYSLHDCLTLQEELPSLGQWMLICKWNLMNARCHSMRVTWRHKHPNQFHFDYSLHNPTFENVQSIKYLGITSLTTQKSKRVLGKVNEEMPQSQTIDQPTALWGKTYNILSCTVTRR